MHTLLRIREVRAAMNSEEYRVIKICDDEYPDKLRNIKDPPGKIYCAGDISLLKGKSVAVVGSRKFTGYGREIAKLIGRELAGAGVIVVSGMAFGIDAFSHEGALASKGKCIAVLGTGLNRPYPACNERLLREVARTGLVVSEYEPNFGGARYSFPRRNRIISGLSECVVVVEARMKSGALITAEMAVEQGRTVYAVPGNINSQFSAGTNMLIHDGAVPLFYVRDLLIDIGLDPTERSNCLKSLGEGEREIAKAVSEREGITIDELCSLLGMKAGTMNAFITLLEIKGVVHSYGGKIYYDM